MTEKIANLIYEEPMKFELDAGGFKNTLDFNNCDISLLPHSFRPQIRKLLSKYKNKRIRKGKVLEISEVVEKSFNSKEIKLSKTYTHKNNWYGNWTSNKPESLDFGKLIEILKEVPITVCSDHKLVYSHILSKEIDCVVVVDAHVDARDEPFNNASFLKFIDKPILSIGFDNWYKKSFPFDKKKIIPVYDTKKLEEKIEGKNTFLTIDLDVLNKEKYFGFRYNDFLPLRTLLWEDIYFTTALLRLKDPGISREYLERILKLILTNSKVKGINIAGFINTFDFNSKTKKTLTSILDRCSNYFK